MEKIIYHFFMRESGGKLMKLNIGTIKINDYREKSLLKNTGIVFNLDLKIFEKKNNEKQYQD